MKKFVLGIVFVKLAFLLCFGVILFSSDQISKLSEAKTSPTASPTVSPKAGESINRPVSEPYTGDLSSFDDANRAEKLQIDRVMDVLEIREDKNVADIGAGSGFFTVRAAKRVGDKGRVFAVEINQEFINHISERAKRENFSNIQTVLGTEDDPKLPENSVDAVLILNAYHEIAQPVKLLKNLRSSLRKGALVGIIDRNGRGDDHGIDKEKVIEEAKSAGFDLASEHDFVKYERIDYFLVFQAR